MNIKDDAWLKVLLVVPFLNIYILPTYYLSTVGIPLSNVIFGLILVVYSLKCLLERKNRISILIYLIYVLGCCVYQKSINPIILLTPIVISTFFNGIDIGIKVKRFLLYSRWIDVSLFFTIFYSMYYFFIEHSSEYRFLHTGIYEVNFSGLAVLLLGLIYYKRNKIFGYIIIALGTTSLSRNYFVAVAIICLFNTKLVKNIIKKFKLSKKITYNFIIISFSVVLYTLGGIAIYKYNTGQVYYFTSFKDRIINFFDISNYFRFTVIFYIVNIFMKQPVYWLIGCDTDTFVMLCYEYAASIGQLYVGNVPHNFLFSYIKLYGLGGFICVLMSGRVLSKFVKDSNYFIILIIACYSIFLSGGANSWWLILTVIILILYNDELSSLKIKMIFSQILKFI